MRSFPGFVRLGLMLACLLFAKFTSNAQSFGLSASVSPSPVVISNTLTYVINITNTSGLTLTNAFVTNLISSSAVIISASNSLTISSLGFENPILFTSDAVVFQFIRFTNNVSAVLTLKLNPIIQTGPFTNIITAVHTNATSVTNTLVTQVFAAQADLAVSISGPGTPVLTNDLMSFGLAVTNLGPTAVANVTLSNALPSSFIFLNVSPTNYTYTATNGNLVFSLGTLASNASARLQVNVQPTNAGSFTLFAVATAPDLLDTNSVNDSVSTNINIGSFLSGDLQVTFISAQYANRQTGLTEQTIRVTNIGTTDVPAVRLLVSGITSSNSLYNAVGTNAGRPFVLYNTMLGTNQSVDFLLEFYVLRRSGITNLTFNAVAVPSNILTAPLNSLTNVVAKGRYLGTNGFLIQFPSIPGRTYTIIYNDMPSFTNSLPAQPSIVAPADRTYWIDNGPPKTLTKPAETPQRFYRVIQID